MLTDKKDWEEYALFGNRARVSCRTMQKNPSGRHGPFMEPGMLAGWQYVSMYSISVDNHPKVCTKLMENLVRHECSQLLPFSSPLIVNYAM